MFVSMPECSILKFSEVSLHMYKEMIYYINTTITKININVRASMSLNIHVITDQHYRINSYYSCPSCCPPLSTTLTLTDVLPLLLFSLTAARAGVLYRSPGRARARPHALARPTRWNSWPQSVPPPAPAGRWRHDVINYNAACAGMFSPVRHVMLTWDRKALAPVPSWNGSNTGLA